MTSWPLARLLPQGISKLVAHEYSPNELSDSFLWVLFLKPFKLWCSKFAHLGVTRFCVEQHLCDLWYRFSGCDFQLLPNSSAFTPAPKPTNAISKPIRVLHHGVAHPSRRIELMVEAIALAGPSFSVHSSLLDLIRPIYVVFKNLHNPLVAKSCNRSLNMN